LVYLVLVLSTDLPGICPVRGRILKGLLILHRVAAGKFNVSSITKTQKVFSLLK
jgi:hypothetical protein